MNGLEGQLKQRILGIVPHIEVTKTPIISESEITKTPIISERPMIAAKLPLVRSLNRPC